MLCRVCGEDKPESEFYVVTNKGNNRKGKTWTYRRTECKSCNNAAAATRYQQNHTAYRATATRYYYRNNEHGGIWDYGRAKSSAKKRGATQFCTKEEWVELRKGTACAWCEGGLHPSFTHVDHVIPLCEGGQHTIDNLVLSCANCNARREWERKVNVNAQVQARGSYR